MRVDEINVDDLSPRLVSISERIAVDAVDDLTFVAPASGDPGPRMFGGSVAGQAIMAAGQTVPQDRLIHSAHMHYLLGGDNGVPVRHEVEVERDGGSFSARRIVSLQPGSDGQNRPIFTMSASFQGQEAGLEHQLPALIAPPPEDTPTPEEMFAGDEHNLAQMRVLTEVLGIEVRFPEFPARSAASRGFTAPPRQRAWMRARLPIEEGPLHQMGAMAFVSDLFLLSAALGPHGYSLESGKVQAATINHTVWFHAPLAVDSWFLYEQESPWAAGGRALSRGLMFNRDGRLCATAMQECLLRVRPES